MKNQIKKNARRANAVFWAVVTLALYPACVFCDAIEGINNGVNRKAFDVRKILRLAVHVIKHGEVNA